MSLHDRLRDEIYGSAEDRQDLEVYADGISSLLDSTALHVLGRRLLLAITADGLIAIFVVFKPAIVVDVLAEYLLIVPILVFALGFFIGFSVFRIYRQAFGRGEAPVAIDRGVMSGYTGYNFRSKHHLIWFVAAASAILNVVVFAALAWTF